MEFLSMNLKLLLIGLVVSVATVTAATKPASVKEQAKAVVPPTVKDTQVLEMKSITDAILAGAKGVSGPQVVFNMIKGMNQINAIERETPLSGAITSAIEKGYTIICYENSKVVAATDPTLLGKDASEFKTTDGRTVLDLVVSNLQASGKDDRAFFTYETQSSDAPMVNGKRAAHTLVADAIGRNSFPFPLSKDKYLLMLVAPINL